MERRQVIVLGGGVAGLTAAHELAERGFQVSVYERRTELGGKARSIAGKSLLHGMKEVPGEHGFRFFPGFYQHVIETMARSPAGKEGKCVKDNLVHATRCMLARYGHAPVRAPFGFPQNWEDFVLLVKFLVQGNGVSRHDNLHFLRCLIVLMTTCQERYEREYDHIKYWDFIGAEDRGEAYRKMLGQGFTRSLVAMRAEESSTRTIGTVFCQMIYPMLNPFAQVDRVLNGPTSDVWIEPWVAHLKSLGVNFVLGRQVSGIQTKGARVGAVTLTGTGAPTFHLGVAATPVEVDEGGFVISALPIHAVQFLTKRFGGEPIIPEWHQIHKLETRWMNGIQIYLKKDVPLVHGHALYVDSPWALTSISQRQFWSEYSTHKYGEGKIGGILSVDISEYARPGELVDKCACNCTHDELFKEVWHQLKKSLNHNHQVLLRDEDILDYYVDNDTNPNLRDPFAGPDDPYHGVGNSEPLFINKEGTYGYRPGTKTSLSNFFLASDYVVTNTDLATMEAANESGRRAANAVLDAVGSTAPRAKVWPLHQPWYVRPWQWLDARRLRKGKPHLFSSPEMRYHPGTEGSKASAASAGSGSSTGGK